jgi:hypothetical protein
MLSWNAITRKPYYALFLAVGPSGHLVMGALGFFPYEGAVCKAVDGQLSGVHGQSACSDTGAGTMSVVSIGAQSSIAATGQAERRLKTGTRAPLAVGIESR